MKKFFAEFKTFAMRGNVIDMAVGVVIGGAFGKITTSIVNDLIMPLISMLTGGVDFSQWKWVLKEAVLDAEGAVATAEVAVNFGATIAVILDFIIIAFAVFCMVKALNKAGEKKRLAAEAEAAAKKAAEEAAAAEAAAIAAATPTKEEALLAEIRDLLKAQGK